MSKNKSATATSKNTKPLAGKPAPALPKGASVTPIKPSKREEDEELELDEDEENDDDGDDGDDGEELEVRESADGKKPRRAPRSQKVRYVKRATALRARLEKMRSEASQTPAAHAAAADALKALAAFIVAAEALPEDWKRVSSARPGKSFAQGDIVKISETFISKYNDILEADEMDDLTVVKTAGKLTVVRGKAGKMPVPTAHLVMA